MEKRQFKLAVDESGRISHDRMLLPETLLNEIQDSHTGSPWAFCISADEENLDVQIEKNITRYKDQNMDIEANVNDSVNDDKAAKRVVFGVVREFTAPEQTVVVSTYASHLLGVPSGELVWVRMQTLPKLSRAAVVPLSQRYLAVRDIRALLESHLRKYRAILSHNEVLSVPTPDGDPVEFRIDELYASEKPVCAGSVIDTDIELIIQPPSGMLLQQNDNETVNIELDKTKKLDIVHEINVPEKNYKYFAIRFKAPITVHLRIECLNGDVDAFVSRLVQQPSIRDWTWRLIDYASSKEMTLRLDGEHPKYATTPEDTLYVALYGYGKSNSCRFAIRVAPEENKVGISVDDSKSSQEIPDQRLCPNCKAPVPERTFEMHLAFCERNNKMCPDCHQVFKKQEFDRHWHCPKCNKIGIVDEEQKHNFYFHDQFTCSCSESFTLVDYSHHRTTTCPMRLIICRFCHTTIQAGPLTSSLHDKLNDVSMTQHESECGNRTIQCRQCNAFVRLKDVPIHMSLHNLSRKQQPDPIQLCKNKVCSDDEDRNNGMGLCRACFGPFWSSELDQGNQKRMQKLLHAYFNQLTKGCGQYCKTSRHPKQKEFVTTSDPTELALVALELTKKEAEYWLCVARKTSNQIRKLADGLSELGFSVPWCVKALRETRAKVVAIMVKDGDSDDEDERIEKKDDGEDEREFEVKWLEYAATYLAQNAPPIDQE